MFKLGGASLIHPPAPARFSLSVSQTQACLCLCPKFMSTSAASVYLCFCLCACRGTWSCRRSWRTRTSRPTGRRRADGGATRRALTLSLGCGRPHTSPTSPSRASSSCDAPWTQVSEGNQWKRACNHCKWGKGTKYINSRTTDFWGTCALLQYFKRGNIVLFTPP